MSLYYWHLANERRDRDLIARTLEAAAAEARTGDPLEAARLATRAASLARDFERMQRLARRVA